eukprot:scaffold13944_cov35-Tisochrysis_lutea.AAC.2
MLLPAPRTSSAYQPASDQAPDPAPAWRQTQQPWPPPCLQVEGVASGNSCQDAHAAKEAGKEETLKVRTHWTFPKQ